MSLLFAMVWWFAVCGLALAGAVLARACLEHLRGTDGSSLG